MMEFLTLLLLFGALLYRNGLSMLEIGMISTLTSAFFFMNYLSWKAGRYALLLGMVVVAGAGYMALRTETVPQDFFIRKNFSGTIQSADRELDKTVFVVKDLQYKFLVQVSVHSKNILLPGDSVKVYGTLDQPEDFMTNTGRLFPYRNYLASKGIVAIVSNAEIIVISQGKFSLNRTGTIIRFAIADIYTKYIAFPIDGIVAGIVSGFQGGIPGYINDLFRATGVLHVLVLSGENITLLAVFLSVVLQPLPFKVRSFLTVLAIILMVIISGSGVSAIRAGIMGVIAISAGLLRRSYVPLRALTLSVVFFYFYSPQTIFVDPGFHLSVLATIFMIAVLPKVEKLFQFLPEKYSIREISILAICVPLFMLPYTMYFSGLVPMASPFANIFMVIVTPSMMLIGAGMIAISWIGPFARVAGTLVSWIGTVTVDILRMLNELPQLNAPSLSWWGVILSYLVFFAVVFRKELKQFYFDQQKVFLPRANSSEPESP
jgi:competence protein ComEC